MQNHGLGQGPLEVLDYLGMDSDKICENITTYQITTYSP